MYGGRAIDFFDRRVLNTYMDEYMGDFIFDTFQPFHFYHNEEVDYRIPEEGPRDNYTGNCPLLIRNDNCWCYRFNRYFAYFLVCDSFVSRPTSCLLSPTKSC